MLELFIAALLALGIVTSSDQATQEVIDQYQMEIDQYIIDTDVEQV